MKSLELIFNSFNKLEYWVGVIGVFISLKLSSVSTLNIFLILFVNVKTDWLTLTISLQMLNKLQVNEFIVANVINILYNSHFSSDSPTV